MPNGRRRELLDNPPEDEPADDSPPDAERFNPLKHFALQTL
jgi:hypothetical protein